MGCVKLDVTVMQVPEIRQAFTFLQTMSLVAGSCEFLWAAKLEV